MATCAAIKGSSSQALRLVSERPSTLPRLLELSEGTRATRRKGRGHSRRNRRMRLLQHSKGEGSTHEGGGCGGERERAARGGRGGARRRRCGARDADKSLRTGRDSGHLRLDSERGTPGTAPPGGPSPGTAGRGRRARQRGHLGRDSQSPSGRRNMRTERRRGGGRRSKG